MAKLNIKNCVRCNKIFAPTSGEKICPDCRAAELEMEERVKTYVREHRGATVNQVIEESGVPAKLVWRMIQQGLFENAGLVNAEYPCNVCGKIITTGLYCSECASKLKENAQKFVASMAARKRAPEKKQTFSDSMHNDINNSRNR